jgi:hypothetical protein
VRNQEKCPGRPERGKHWGGDKRRGQAQDEAHALAFCSRVSGQMGVAQELVSKRPGMSATPAGVRLCREGSGVWSDKRKTGRPQAGECGSAVLEFARNDEAGGAEAEREKACRIGAILTVLSGKCIREVTRRASDITLIGFPLAGLAVACN